MKCIRHLKAALVSTLLLAGFSANAAGGSGILFDMNLFYDSWKAETSNTGSTNATVTGDSASSIYDIKLGYLMTSGFYIGGLYTSRSNTITQTTTSGSATGVSFGYMGQAGLFVQGHYLMSATSGTYSEGSGMQLDVGYKAGVGSGLLLGAELTYRNIDYKKDSGNANLASYKTTEVLPMVSIGYLF